MGKKRKKTKSRKARNLNIISCLFDLNELNFNQKKNLISYQIKIKTNSKECLSIRKEKKFCYFSY